MKRKIMNKLLDWKNDANNKPLMVLGARQVGKTYIINEFCKNNFKNYISVNLLDNDNIVMLYERKDINSDQKYNYLKTLLNFDIDQEDTILFIDEIQESEELISELKYFCEKHNNVKIICAGSLLGVKLKRFNSSFPVGKVKMINMYPMDFEEFLLANNRKLLLDEIKNAYEKNTSLPDEIHSLCLEFYRFYLITGGMPESVSNFIENDCDIMKYDNTIKENIISAYIKDMKNYVKSEAETIKIEKIYKSIPTQIANESRKFQFSKIEKNSRSRDYDEPLSWLEASNLVLTSYRVSRPLIPLKGYVDFDFYKLFINDIGLLNHFLEIRNSDIITDNLSLFKGAIVENYVATQFASNEISLYYWLSEGIAEVDFLLYNEDGIIPVEVKASDNTQSKSLKMFMENYNPKYAIRISTKNFGYNEVSKIKSIPLYAVFLLKYEEKMKQLYNKLVRDKIPNIIKNNGGEPYTRILSNDEYIENLKKKLIEECNEVVSAKTKEDTLEELADTFEVVRSLAKALGYSYENLIDAVENKATKRGGFNKKIFLEKVIEKD